MNFGRFSFIQILVFSLLAHEVRFWKWTVIASEWILIEFPQHFKSNKELSRDFFEVGPNDCFHWSNLLAKIAFNCNHNVFVFESLWRWYFNGNRWTKEKFYACTLYYLFEFGWLYLTKRFFQENTKYTAKKLGSNVWCWNKQDDILF